MTDNLDYIIWKTDSKTYVTIDENGDIDLTNDRESATRMPLNMARLITDHMLSDPRLLIIDADNMQYKFPGNMVGKTFKDILEWKIVEETDTRYICVSTAVICQMPFSLETLSLNRDGELCCHRPETKYIRSNVRRYLQNSTLLLLSDYMRLHIIVANDYDDLIRIPTKAEISKWFPNKSFKDLNGTFVPYWLQDEYSSNRVWRVGTTGNFSTDNPSITFGVLPVIELSKEHFDFETK